ncbi:PorV/PorQ family protein [candidate division KSB1 bacterium]|nr:MAG: PorV/PorQ family protein [candidate division KSB1 bacterium]
MKRFTMLMACVFLTVSYTHAAKYAGEFLEIGVGARGVAMGGAMSAHTDDPMSFYWNPAGMGYISAPHAAGMYADLWDGLANYSTAGLTLPISGAVFSVNYVRLGVPEIQKHNDYAQARNRVVNGDTLSVQEYLLTTGARPRGIFGASETAIFITFAKLNRWNLDLGWSYFQIPLEIPFGVNLKLLNQSLDEAKGSGIGADFGMQVRFRMSDVFWEKWKASLAWGFNWQDVTRTGIDWGENNKDMIPTNFRTGVAYTHTLPGRDSRIILSYDSEKRWDHTDHFGLEYQFASVLALRGGFWDDEWTAGAGLSIWRATVDYAYLSRELGNTHRVSVAFRLR